MSHMQSLHSVVSVHCLCINFAAPNVAPKRVVVNRTSETAMTVSWMPLNLSEARGFVIFYSIAYTPVQASPNTAFMNARADSSSVEVVGLERSLAYSVAVAAATNADIGVQSTSVVAEPLFTNTGKQHDKHLIHSC